jgi:hypothetical protein
MSKKDFTEKELKILSQNKYVNSVTFKKITYTNEFKLLYMLYYNKYRYQWNLKKMTPVEYRNHLIEVA